MCSHDASASTSPPEPNRRAFAAACIGAAATGATWMTGFSLIIRGRHPQLLVVGDDAWQVMLIEHGSNRIVILNGEFERSPEQEIDRLCSVLRQHVDVVAGTRTALSLLSNDFRSRRSVDTLIQLDGAPDQPGSPGFVSMARPIAVRAGAVELQLRPLP